MTTNAPAQDRPRDHPGPLAREGGRGPGPLMRFIPRGESVLLRLRPSLWFILIRALPWLLGAFAVWRWGGWGLRSAGWPVWAARLEAWALTVAVLALGWYFLEWLSRAYVLTERRLIAVAGILFQSISEAPLRDVRTLAVTRSLIERILGLGSLGAGTAGTGAYEVVWVMLARPDAVLARVRRAVTDAAEGSNVDDRHVTPVIGLVGGIGAGKSAVAAAFARHGCLVIDSDKEAKAALDLPQVRDQLVDWWGPEVLDADGRVDRSKVAAIIFSDPDERARLESVVHPLVKSRRGEVIERARAEGKSGVIIDAPLLLEAGSDAECDVVVFVDAPRERRLERIRARGWDEAELARRESAQLGLDEKRRRSDFVIDNSGPVGELDRIAGEVLDRARAAAARGDSGPRRVS